MHRLLLSFLATMLIIGVPALQAQDSELPAGSALFADDEEHPRFHRGHGKGHRGKGLRGLSQAFPPPGYLDLDESQQEAAQALREELRGELAPVRDQMRSLRESLREGLESENPDSAQVGDLMLQIRELRQQNRSTAQSYRERFRELLTAEQQVRLDHFEELREQRRERRRGPRAERN